MEKTLPTKIEKRFFSSSELRSFLRDYAGMNIAKSTVYMWSTSGTIPRIKSPTGRLLFPVDDVKQWIDGKQCKSHEAGAYQEVQP